MSDHSLLLLVAGVAFTALAPEKPETAQEIFQSLLNCTIAVVFFVLYLVAVI